jgi:epoxyqueuosine reductase QueG
MDGLCFPECTICLEGCPTGALLGEAKIDRQKCARKIFDYGLRRVMKFMGEMMKGSPEKRDQLIKGHDLRELWQNFMTGNYYYCFECQNLCPVGKNVVTKTR